MVSGRREQTPPDHASDQVVRTDTNASFAVVEAFPASTYPGEMSLSRLVRHIVVLASAVSALLVVTGCSAVQPAYEDQRHLVVLGNSVAFGASDAGVRGPKDVHSWPGLLRESLDEGFGAAGTGKVLMNEHLVERPEWSSHVSFGDGVESVGFGLHRSAAVRLSSDAENAYVRFDSEADEFWVSTLKTGDAPIIVEIDGEPVGTITNGDDRAASLPPEEGTTGRKAVTRVPAAGGHTLTIRAPEDGSAIVTGIEARIDNPGAWRVTNASINGRSLWTLFAGPDRDDDENALFGLASIDSFGADTLLIALGTNDWHGGATKGQIKEWLVTVIDRQAETGGDSVIFVSPRPALDPDGFPRYVDTAVVPWTDLHGAAVEAAEETGAFLIDLSDLFGDFDEAYEHGLFADDLHPSDEGSRLIADAVHQELMGR